MSICVISVLLIRTQLFSSTPVIPVFVQLPLSQKGYSDSSRPSPFQGVRMTEGASQALLLKKIEPEYPAGTGAEGLEGDVIFRIIIGTDGRVQEIHLRRGKPILIEAAAKAVSQWQYEPYMLNGKAAEVETFATVRFRQPVKHR